MCSRSINIIQHQMKTKTANESYENGANLKQNQYYCNDYIHKEIRVS